MDEDEAQFETIWAKNSHSYKRVQDHVQVLKQCRNVEQILVHQFFIELTQKIAQQCKLDWLGNNTQQLYTIQFQRNQRDQFQKYIRHLTQYFQSSKWKIFQNISPQKINVIYLMKSQTQDILLHIYIYLKQNPKYQVVVFMVQEITDLDQDNIYCFVKGLNKGQKCIIVACSHYNFQNIHQSSESNFQIYHYEFYKSKDLFCRYLYNCMININIKPYLPPEVLNLIKDIDKYRLSYHESCRRFIYCVQKSLFLYKRQRKFIQFDGLINLIQFSVLREFKYHHGAKKMLKQKILKIVLTQKQAFYISEIDLSFQIKIRTSLKNEQIKEEDNIIYCMRERLNKQLKRRPEYSNYTRFLEQKNEVKVQKIVRRKKTRAQMLGIDLNKPLNAKKLFENQITQMIKDKTSEIRLLASHIKWQDIKYQLRISPQIPYLIKKSWVQDDNTQSLLDDITQKYSAPLAQYLRLFERQNLGEGIYLMKCLEYSGLIEISKGIKPIVYTNYYDKASFANVQS